MFREILGDFILWLMIVSGLLYVKKYYGGDDE